MPNWVYNKITFGDAKVLKECIAEYEEGGQYFDFNKLIPMPKELDEHQAPIRDEKIAKEMVKKYGAPDWYAWRLKNWDTKWLPSETVVVDEYTVEFQTPWSVPYNILREISKKYHTSVVDYYADEDLGSNCGTLKFDNGEIMEDDLGDFEFACEVWGFDPDEEKALLEEE